jgi:hypothetical protein
MVAERGNHQAARSVPANDGRTLVPQTASRPAAAVASTSSSSRSGGRVYQVQAAHGRGSELDRRSAEVAPAPNGGSAEQARL